MKLNAEEMRRYRTFVEWHYTRHKFSGGVPVTITPTGIGNHVSVKCPKCKKKKDITNYEAW